MHRQVWIINHYAQSPSESGGLTRHHSLAAYLDRHGWRASIIAASTGHPSGQQRDVAVEAPPAMVDGVPFMWFRAPNYTGNGRDRIRNMLAFAWRVATSRTTNTLAKPDVVIGSSPHPATALAAAWLARRHRVPFVLEVRDLWPQALIDMGRISENGLTARAMRVLERYLFRTARRSITLWPNVLTYMRERGIDAPPPAWIPNGIDLGALPPAQPLPDRAYFTLMYLGSHGGANALDNVIRAMRIVEERAPELDIRLRLVGEGPQKAALRKLAHNIGSTRVTFESAVPKSRVPHIAAEADAFVFNLIRAPMFRYGISPNKLYEYMAAQRPVIFCCEAFNNPIADSGGGISAQPGDPVALADAILQLAALPLAKRGDMAAAGRRHVEAHFSFEKLARDLAQLLDDCTKKS